MTFAITRPRLYILVIKDEQGHIEQLLQLLVSIMLFIWLHRYVFLRGVEIVGKIGDILGGIKEAYLSLFAILLEPAQFVVGVG
jgi:hypothetical protein